MATLLGQLAELPEWESLHGKVDETEGIDILDPVFGLGSK